MRLSSAAEVIALIGAFYDRQIAHGAVRMLPDRPAPDRLAPSGAELSQDELTEPEPGRAELTARAA
jgi:hypothetical protein